MKTCFPFRFGAWLGVVFLTLLLTLEGARAGSATWNLNPTSGDWNTAANWTPETVPNGPTDTATFDASNITDLSLSAVTEVEGIVFNPGASAFMIDATKQLTISGTGITNNSGVTQTFIAATGHPVPIMFTHAATAGSGTMFINSKMISSPTAPERELQLLSRIRAA